MLCQYDRYVLQRIFISMSLVKDSRGSGLLKALMKRPPACLAYSTEKMARISSKITGAGATDKFSIEVVSYLTWERSSVETLPLSPKSPQAPQGHMHIPTDF